MQKLFGGILSRHFSSMASVLSPFRPSWQQTMYRIKDPKISIPFYEKNFDFTLVDRYDFADMNFSLYFMATLPTGEKSPSPGTEEAHKYLWNFKGTVIELTHNHGSENDANLKFNNGNVEPHRGFGHIAVHCDDVYATCETLEKNGVKFQKKPDEGRMKGLAFALDPDGYWIEIIKRHPEAGFSGFNLSQTMFRVKDPQKSLNFYQKIFGMRLLSEKHFPEAKFSLYFLASLPEDEALPDKTSPEANDYIKKMFNPVLELTHNHGTESDENFSYHNGNDEPKGFGHIGFLVDNIDGVVEALDKEKVRFKKRPYDGKMKGISFVLDPDGYSVELIPRDYVLSYN